MKSIDSRVTKDSRWRLAQAALTLVGASGVVLVFVPFTYDLSPFTDVFLDFGTWTEGFWLLSVACILLPIPISLGYAQWLITGRLAQWTVATSYVLAAAFAGTSLAGFIALGPDETEVVILIILFIISFTCSAWLGMQGVRGDSAVRGLVAMQCAYLPPMTFWVMFADTERDFQIGAMLGAVTLLAYLGQIALATKHARWLLVVVAPMAGIVLQMLSTRT